MWRVAAGTRSPCDELRQGRSPSAKFRPLQPLSGSAEAAMVGPVTARLGEVKLWVRPTLARW
jgi:hypothetical protein